MRQQNFAIEHWPTTYYDTNLGVPNPQILLIEDDPFFYQIWHSMLKNLDSKIELAWVKSSEEAESLIAKPEIGLSFFDLILSDIFLKGDRTGIDFWSQNFLKTQNRLTQFILVSALSIEQLLKKVDGTWAIPAYLEKPLDRVECQSMVRNMLAKSRRLKV